MITLFFSPKEKKYYLTGLSCCKACDELIGHGSPFIAQQFNDSNKKATRFFYCTTCFGKVTKFGNASMFLVGIALQDNALLPNDAIMVVQQRIELASGFVTSGDLRNRSPVKIVDRTRWVGRDMPEIDYEATKLLAERRIVELETPLDKVDFDAFIQQQTSAVPLLPEKPIVKLLECTKL